MAARVQIEGITRSAFILRGAFAVGGAYGLGAVGPYVAGALAQRAQDDVDVVQFAYSLEQLETAFYKAALKPRVGLSGQVKKLATAFGAHEAEHAATLKQLIEQLGSKPEAAPKAKFDVSDRESFLKLAIELEETGVAAYNGAAASIASKDILNAAGQIVQVEARHAGALRMLAGQDPAPQAFDKAASAQQVSARVKPFLTQGR